MLYIVIQNFDEKLIYSIKYIFLNYKINFILNSQIDKFIQADNKFIFFTKFLNPTKTFIDTIKHIINTYDYCSLSKNNEIFFTKSKNITFNNNIIDILKPTGNTKKIIFYENYNPFDHIIIHNDINSDYFLLLKKYNKSYDNIIDFNIAYKSYDKFIKNMVKDNCCYNLILFINNINQLYLTLPKYEFYRITIFHSFKNEYDLQLLNGFINKNKIKSAYYIDNKFNFFFEINNKRSIWFEKIVLINDIKTITSDLFLTLNKYHQFKDNILLNNIISVTTTDFVQIPFFTLSKHFYYSINQVFKFTKLYFIENTNNYYIKQKLLNDNPLKFKVLPKYLEKQLMTIRNYNMLIDNINSEIKNNYDHRNVGNLLIKKISLYTLCRDEKDILNEITIIIQSINNLEFLNNLVILFSQIKNQKILNKLYVKVLKLTKENKLNYITLKCFQSLLSASMDEEELLTVLDFINSIKDDHKIIDNTKLKNLIMTLFVTISKFIDNSKVMETFNSLVNSIFNLDNEMTIDKILSLNTTNNVGLLHFMIFLSTNFSAYYPSFTDFINKRNEIKNNLEYLLTKNLPICPLDNVLLIPVCNFYLSYQGLPSSDIFKLKSQLIRKICPELNYSIDLHFTNKKINICFHSNFLNRWHSVFKDRHQIIKYLSLSPNFNVYFSTFDDLNEDVKYLFGNAKHIKLSNLSLSQIRDKMAELKLDVLVYCEIGMDPKSYFMAHMKLAKKQINTWGHSDSCGIDTVDYFFSSKLYELPYDESQTHYSEKLILLDSLCTCYVNPLSKYNINTFKDRYEFGFSDDVIIYFCAQSLFKFNPKFDDYLSSILSADPNAVLIILNNDSKSKLIKRFNNKNIVSRIHFFQGMTHNMFLNLMNVSDVILDPYPFGGCNSSLEAFSLNKVVVTHPSDMINGRFTLGFYKRMNLEEIAAKTKEEYINLAIKLGQDKDYRKTIEDKIKDNHRILFNEKESCIDWEQKIFNINK